MSDPRDDSPLSQQEQEEVASLALSMSDSELVESLEAMIWRESELMRDRRFSEDPDNRMITLHNIAALVASLTSVKRQSGSGTAGSGSDPDRPDIRPTPE